LTSISGRSTPDVVLLRLLAIDGIRGSVSVLSLAFVDHFLCLIDEFQLLRRQLGISRNQIVDLIGHFRRYGRDVLQSTL
jgi:hypothetical protein